MGLEGKVALVTGAGSGIGEAAAKLLGKEGVKVGVLDLDAGEVEQVTGEIRSAGGRSLPLAADVSDPEEIGPAIQRLVDEFGRLDVVFANAGINGVWAPLEELTLKDWNQTLNVNLTGTFLTIKYSTPYLKQRGGSVIITSSVNGNRIFSNTGATAYSASKAGQTALAKMLALELASDRIRVNVICPGAIETEIGENTEMRNLEQIREPAEYPEGNIPLTDGEPGKPEQVAQLVRFLASDAASFITGTEIYIDGAGSLLRG